MTPTLHLDGGILNGNTRGLWRLLLDHTACERSTARILLEIAEARRAGPIAYCVVVREAGPSDSAPPDERSWRIHVAHAPSDVAYEPDAPAAVLQIR